MSSKALTYKKTILMAGMVLLSGVAAGSAFAQDRLPRDNGIHTYHFEPRYRPSEEHPLRTLGYIVHPIGWALREGIYRPLSSWISGSPTRRSVFGFREPYDWRETECFNPDASTPDCRSLLPFNYNRGDMAGGAGSDIHFPDVNFDFNSRKLNQLGRGRCGLIAEKLKSQPGVNVVLEGHTDHLGSAEYNDKLGLDRADAVRSELVSQGVDAATLSTVTFGKSKPLVDQKTDWARAVNRRVEVQGK
jgi:outer membrane protein OmpA-like peptidoglycan-associated protein